MSTQVEIKRREHEIKRTQSIRRLDYIVDEIGRGVDPLTAVLKMEEWSVRGKGSEELALKALSKSPLVEKVHKATLIDDVDNGIDMWFEPKRFLKVEKVFVQVKSTSGGVKYYLQERGAKMKIENLGEVLYRLAEENRIVISAGDKEGEAGNILSIQSQVANWFRIYKKVDI